ncbi:MAG: hypothetical protein ACREX8_15195 [Gammaproteobacteria bacterium]
MRFARAASVLMASCVIGALAVAGVATAAAAMQSASISVSPSSGPPGSGFTITFGNFASGRNCPQIHFLWDNEPIASVDWAAKGSVNVAVPGGAKPGPHFVTGRNACQSVARDLFLVVPGPRPTTTTPAPVPTVPINPSPTSSRQPTTTTTRTTTTTTTSTETTTVTTKISTGPGTLIFDRPSIQAGEPLTASGTGCEPGAPVTLTANGERVGATTADSDGRFTTSVEFTRIQPGRHIVTAACGPVLTGGVDLVLTSSTSGNTATVVVLVFFLLAAVTLVARTRNGTLW